MRRFLLLLLLISLPFTASSAASKRGAKKTAAEARTLYDQGRFDEALPLLETLDREGHADGPLLYRLAYCQRSSGKPEIGRATEQRAVTLLEKELEGAEDLEVPFYLSNAYRNGERSDDALRVARETLARIEAGKLETSDGASDLFRVGKLYADVDRGEEASRWFARLLDVPDASAAPDSYVQWASRFLADRARRSGDTASFERYLTRFVDAGGDPADGEISQLAVARYRTGRYDEASTLWKRMQSLSPTDPDRYRYAARLARMAAKLGSLPDRAPTGRLWSELGKEELEAAMREQAERVRQTIEETHAIDVLTTEHRKALRATVSDAKPKFVAAALEYAVRGFPIRETAFFSGFAPLIFRDQAWWLMRAADGSSSEPVSPVADQR